MDCISVVRDECDILEEIKNNHSIIIMYYYYLNFF